MYKFMIFDIKDYYPSITIDLSKTALRFAVEKINISEENKNIIFHARKSLLFNEGNTWMKKGNNLFDVTMGAYDGVEVCELIGIYILLKLSLTLTLTLRFNVLGSLYLGVGLHHVEA